MRKHILNKLILSLYEPKEVLKLSDKTDLQESVELNQ